MGRTARSTKLRDQAKALTKVEGILTGICSDCKIDPAELQHLNTWLTHNSFMAEHWPFRELHNFVRRVLEDDTIDDSEQEEFIDFCRRFSAQQKMIIRDITTNIRRLHGFLQGIVCDDVVNSREVAALHDWASSHPDCHHLWPFCEIMPVLSRVKSLEHLTDASRTEFLQMSRSFLDAFVDDRDVSWDETVLTEEPWFRSSSPVVQTIDMVCDSAPDITFARRSFCFTGQMKAGKRSNMHRMVTELGGIAVNNVSKSLNYLVIGADSNPCWAYSSYGRKIEAVKNARSQGGKTLIVRESDFMASMARAVPKD